MLRLLNNALHVTCCSQFKEVKWFDSDTNTYSSGRTYYSLNTLAQNIRAKLRVKYLPWVEHAKQYVPILVAVLTQHQFAQKSDPVSGTGTVGNEWSVERACSFGLLRLSKANTIEMPFILLWMLAVESGDAQLADFGFDDFDKQRQQLDQSMLSGLIVWQDFEVFVARFCALRSRLFAGQTVSVAQFHSGARFRSPADAKQRKMLVTEVKHVLRATKQYDSRSVDDSGKATSASIIHESGTVDIDAGQAVVINGSSAPHADVFRSISLQGPPLLEHVCGCSTGSFCFSLVE
jgi:hypothetical protein